MARIKMATSAGKVAWALIVLMFSLMIIFFVLAWLHKSFGTNFVGQVADFFGKRATGQSYQF